MKKISIIMAYYNRKNQILRTLDGFEKSYVGKYNFEVMIVDDNSKDIERLDKDLKKYTFSIKYIFISEQEKGSRINPCEAYNRGLTETNGDIVILQNPECYHVNDIFDYTLKHLTTDNYLSFSCFAPKSYDMTNSVLNNLDIMWQESSKCNWYNHPTFKKTNYHFCSAITRDNIRILGGFNLTFKDGYCYDDDELVLEIKEILKLDIICVDPISCLVIHQYHEPNVSTNISGENDTNLIKQKWLKNKMTYESNLLNLSTPFSYPRLLHVYWDGSKLSFLNYLTLISFNHYHSNWRVILHRPKYPTIYKSWLTNEHNISYEGTCYLNKVKQLSNLTINLVDFQEIGFINEASEVIKSDYLRYYMLNKYGGVWSDFDIIYVDSIEKKFKDNTDVVLFKSDMCIKQKGHLVKLFPIGLLISKRNSQFYTSVLKQIDKYYDPNSYQCIGCFLITDIYQKFQKSKDIMVYKSDEYYLPFNHYEIDMMINGSAKIFHQNIVGIHWYNGSNLMKQYQIELDRRIQSIKDHNYDSFDVTCILDEYVKKILKYNNDTCFL